MKFQSVFPVVLILEIVLMKYVNTYFCLNHCILNSGIAEEMVMRRFQSVKYAGNVMLVEFALDFCKSVLTKAAPEYQSREHFLRVCLQDQCKWN